MGFKKQSELRRAENEVIFKEYNERIKKHVDKLLSPADKRGFLLGFVCECSDEDCHERIELTFNAFKRISKNRRQFMLIPRHDQGDIERIIEHQRGYDLVEKYEVPPNTDGVLNAT